MMNLRWSNRFIFAALIQGAIVTALTIMLTAFVTSTQVPVELISIIIPNPAAGYIEIAALAGLGLYLVVGVISTAVTAYIYHHFEVLLDKKYRGITNKLAWSHLVLTNIGIAAASLMMIYAGYLGDLAVTPVDDGGWGLTIKQASDRIMNQFIFPIGIMLLATAIGAVCGGVGFIIVYFRT